MCTWLTRSGPDPLCIIWWKPGCPWMAVCFCPSHLISVLSPCSECVHAFMSPACVATPCLECVQCISTCIYAHLTVHVCFPPLCIVSWKLGCSYFSLCVCPSHPGCGPTTLFRMCTCIQYMNLCPSDCPCLVHPLCIVSRITWLPLYSSVFSVPVTSFLFLHLVQNVYMHQYINLCPPYSPGLLHPICIVSLSLRCPYVSLCACPSCLMSVPTPCLECVCAAVHEFMSTWLPMSLPSPMHSFMESCVPLCVTVCVSQSPCLWSPYLV